MDQPGWQDTGDERGAWGESESDELEPEYADEDQDVELLLQHEAEAGEQDLLAQPTPPAAETDRVVHRLLGRLRRRQARPAAGAPDAAAVAAGSSEARSSAASSSGSMSDDEADGSGDADQGRPGCVRFDPNVAARHQYLGDVDELEGSYGHLPEGTTARLPLLVLDGVVLFPGCQLPLLLNTPQELHLLDRALAAPAPFTRLLAVLPGPRSLLRSLARLVCCTVEVRQMRRQGDQEEQGSVAVLALGRQRAEVVSDGRTCAQSQISVKVRILQEGCTSDVPLLMRQGYSAIHPALTRPWDLQLLVGRVRQLMELVLLPAASFQGSPLELSYWVSHNLPLQPSTRQLLLMCSCPADRLRLLLELLQRLDRLCCSACGTQLATTADVLAMTTEGIGATYVNSHGYVHEMVTFSKVQGLRLYGGPETAHSWFPGYAWTIAHCGSCGQHMGWRFTATRPGLSPRHFWGIRRPGLLCATAPSTTGGSSIGSDGDGGEQQGRGLPGEAAVGQEQNWLDLLMQGVRRGRLVLHLRQQQPPAPGAERDAGG